ncbi:MAG: arsenite methyltransferase [Planctomycetota bacterium]|jgi:SAM-dependent methyltransferase
MTSKEETTREMVARAYAQALEASQRDPGRGCCGGPPSPAGTAARSAGYAGELESHPEAGVSSFGCGNPLAFAEVRPGQTVLDLGSGAGLDLLIAAEKVGPQGRVIGVDMTDAMVEAARAHGARAGLRNVEVRRGLIEELPVEDAEVDWVISNCVINLSPEKHRVFAEIRRVLRPGGRISISDIVVEELPAWIRESAAAYASCIAGAISEGDYLAGLRAAGLAEVEVSERHVYSVAELGGIVKSDLGCFGGDAGPLLDALREVEGKVWSARFSGRRPED